MIAPRSDMAFGRTYRWPLPNTHCPSDPPEDSRLFPQDRAWPILRKKSMPPWPFLTAIWAPYAGSVGPALAKELRIIRVFFAERP